MKLAVLGAGCWGLTITKLLNDNFEEITVWARKEDLSDDLIKNKHTSKPLEVHRGTELPSHGEAPGWQKAS